MIGRSGVGGFLSLDDDDGCDQTSDDNNSPGTSRMPASAD